jgi:type II secretory pathway pseudopilin PulG
MLKKAAMFGLDARIALAIFGALSVISGAALYSAIQQSKLTSFYTQVQEVFKAADQYYLDIGTPIQNNELCELVTDSKSLSSWNGPYLSGFTLSGCAIQSPSHPYLSFIISNKLSNVDWPADQSGWGVSCSSGNPCYQWVRYGTSKTTEIESFFNQLDAMVDGSDGPVKGGIRLLKPTGPSYYIYVRGNLILEQFI